MWKAVVFVVSVVMATPVAAQQLAIDSNFRFNRFDWDGFGKTFVIWRPVIIDDRVAICGGYGSIGGRRFSDLTRQALVDMRIEGPNGAILRNLRYFEVLPRRALSPSAAGELASCRVTQTPATAADLSEYRVAITPRRYAFDD